MELSILLFEKIVSMALIMMMGYAARKAHIAREEQIPLISSLMMYVLIPCMVFRSFLMPFTTERFHAFLLAMAGGFASQFLFILVAWALGRSSFHADSTEQACLAYTNCGNLLIPLINSLLGPEYVFYSVPFLAANTIFAWLHIPMLISGQFRPEWRKILLNPAILSVFAGILFFCLRIPLPGILSDTIASVSSSIGVFSMLLTGMLMAGIDLRSVFMNVRYLIVSLMRLILFPLILILIIRITGLSFRSDMFREVLMVVVMGGAAPTATVVLVMSNLFGGKAELASAISAMTTLMCIVTLPLMVLVYQVVC
ncbi:MAG: AEC family transporter [Lachnospiraceae bacterium]|nr:AEC family transporter [Lachnospiraceae bacterium]